MRLVAVLLLLAFLHGPAFAQQHVERKEFVPGAVRKIGDLPPGRLRDQIERLPAQAREQAVAWLGNFHFADEDLKSLHADASGAIFYADAFELPPLEQRAIAREEEPSVAQAAVPVNPFPADLIFHSRMGAPNVLYLDFTGESVSGTAWNDSVGRVSIPAVAYSIDSDFTTFSDVERLAIKRIWQRVAEDYAPFNIDVTTERPPSFNTRTAHALITRNTDANGEENPASTSGGVAYVGVFGTTTYARYRPAWIYANNLGGEESYIAEAVSHEVGHNFGLSHDGTTDGSDYYGGHGSGETSWGPLMGTGYNRNVSQWSKGEYYRANNTQDDLATIAAKLTYRVDDHGDSIGASSSLVVSSNGSISATTPETDPQSFSAANKGVLERSTDVDMFSFTTGTGAITLRVNPWVVVSGRTRGGNVDLIAQLYNASGQLIMTANVTTTTGVLLQANLVAGVYYLAVRSTGVGAPTDAAPSGYSAYGSIGQYFITGSVAPAGPPIPPGAELNVNNITEPGVAAKTFTVRYSDNVGVNVSTIGNNDVHVAGPNGYRRMALLVAVDQTSNGTPRTATYRVDPPAGSTWMRADDGTYTISMLANTVADTEGAYVPASTLGTFRVSVPHAIYIANMESHPGWTFEGLWQYGKALYLLGTGPTAGATGSNIVGYNLVGNYENRLAAAYATTPAIDCSGATSLTLSFKRYLRLRSGDTANIQLSVNGADWTDLWTTSGTVADTAWQSVQYTLPAWAMGSPTLQLRWGMASGQTQNDIGWNIDDVTLLVNGALDTIAPTVSAAAADIVTGGSDVHSFTVTYTDNTGVRVASLGSSDLVVVGPNGFSTAVAFVGVDNNSDGTPRTATYTVPAPNGLWESSDNGVYQIVLQNGEVSDTANNALTETTAGTFSVSIEQPAAVQPQISSISISSGSSVVTVNGTAGVEHVLDASSDLATWESIATNTPSGGTFTFADSVSDGTRFYRVTIP